MLTFIEQLENDLKKAVAESFHKKPDGSQSDEDEEKK